VIAGQEDRHPDRRAFAERQLRIMRSGRPSSGGDLLGMEVDFDHYLSMLDEIDSDSVAVRQTGHAERLLVASCSPAPGVTLASAAEAVRTMWLDWLRYEFTEARCLLTEESLATLEVVTQMSPNGLHVTGAIEIGPTARPS
jgi:hypothetical protein